MNALLVVAGEASGDHAAAAAVARLPRVRAFGLGGAALESRRVELVCDLRSTTALGVGEAAERAWGVMHAYRTIVRTAERRRPSAALLVDYTEFNLVLARRLRAMGVRVLWYGAPQVWAWRPRRTRTLRSRVDRLAVVLPFEERLWRDAGVDARYVGHPAVERAALPRDGARRKLAVPAGATAVALLPGSRPHEARSLLQPMLDACVRVRRADRSLEARVLLASSLDSRTKRWARRRASICGVEAVDVDPIEGTSSLLGAFDAALCASGTASLEAALANAVPVVAYRVGVVTEIVARAAVRSLDVALPNVLLGKRVFVELLQRDARAATMADALTRTLDRRPELLGWCARLASILGAERHPSAAVAGMLAPWLSTEAEMD